MESSEAPLMRGERDDDGDVNDDLDADGDLSLQSRVALSDGSPGLYMWLLTVSAGISGLLFGYDTGVISATLVSIGTALSNRSLTSLDKSIITSSTALFALLVSPFSSAMADAFGRKRLILIADVLFIAGAVLQALSPSVLCVVGGRCVVGAAIGAASFVVPLYIAELAPARHRGRLVTMNVLFITLGQVVAYVVGWAFAEYGSKATGWRWMVGLGAVPAAVQSVLVLFMPESPRWLVRAGRSAEAKAVVERTSGPMSDRQQHAERVLKNIESELRKEDNLHWQHSWRELLSVRRNRRALTIACLLQGLQQLCGFNSLMYFSATIFTMLGFSMPTLTSLTVAITNFGFTVAAILLIDRIGRRRILLYSIPVMVVGLILAAFGFAFIDLSHVESLTGGRTAALIVLVAIMLYVASYAMGLGNVPWLQSELFSLPVRALGSGLATATNWAANFVVGLTFLPILDFLNPSWAFGLYAAVCTVGFALIWLLYPETAGLSLEEAARLLDGDAWAVS